jgi:hypothetical protein
MTSPVVPPVGPNLAIWARQISAYLQRVRARIAWKSTGEAASENGVILWDNENGYPVVSSGGAFSQVALFGSVPASAAAPGMAGQMAWDADYIYVCTATDTWKRVAIATWP